MSENDDVLQNYIIAVNNIQLVDTSVIECHAQKMSDIPSGSEVENKLDLKFRVDVIDNTRAVGMLRTSIDVMAQGIGQIYYKILITTEGRFVAQTGFESTDEYKSVLKNIVVPLLLPYARTSLATVASLLSAPATILPTLDVIKSIRKNENSADSNQQS